MYHPKILDQEKSSALNREGVRLKTFNGMWSKNFIDTKELTKAGFFFTGQSDQVQCAFYAGVVENWDEGEVPIDEHRRHFETCPLVQ